MSRGSELHEKWSRDEGYRAAYDELGPECESALLSWPRMPS